MLYNWLRLTAVTFSKEAVGGGQLANQGDCWQDDWARRRRKVVLVRLLLPASIMSGPAGRPSVVGTASADITSDDRDGGGARVKDFLNAAQCYLHVRVCI